jgi:hypothetical protein
MPSSESRDSSFSPMGHCLAAVCSLIFLLAPPAARAAPPERLVVVLGQNDPVTSLRVLRHLENCTVGVPTAVVSYFHRLRIVQDFTSDRNAVFEAVSRASDELAVSGAAGEGFSLAAQLPPEETDAARSFPAALELLASALAPVGRTTTIVLVSPRVGAASGGFVESTGAMSPYYRSTESEPVSTGDVPRGYLAIPPGVTEARKALRRSGVRVVAVNTRRAYDPGLKALTETPGGRYLQSDQRGFPKRLESALCAPAR